MIHTISDHLYQTARSLPSHGSDRPPSPNLLQTIANGVRSFSESWMGFVAGSYTIKAIGGVLMGLGMAGCIFGGVGLPLVIAGAVLWGLSTVISTARLDELNLKTIALHLLSSVVSGAVGFGAAWAIWAIGAGAATDATPIALIGLTALCGLQITLWDFDDLINSWTDRQSCEPRLADEPRETVDAAVLRNLQKKYREQKETIELTKGDETIRLKIDLGRDCISLTNLLPEEEHDFAANRSTSSRSTRAPVWVALRQTAAGQTPATYTLHEEASVCRPSGTFESDLHPITRVPLTADSLLSGGKLLAWLDPTFKDADYSFTSAG